MLRWALLLWWQWGLGGATQKWCFSSGVFQIDSPTNWIGLQGEDTCDALACKMDVYPNGEFGVFCPTNWLYVYERDAYGSCVRFLFGGSTLGSMAGTCGAIDGAVIPIGLTPPDEGLGSGANLELIIDLTKIVSNLHNTGRAYEITPGYIVDSDFCLEKTVHSSGGVTTAHKSVDLCDAALVHHVRLWGHPDCGETTVEGGVLPQTRHGDPGTVDCDGGEQAQNNALTYTYDCTDFGVWAPAVDAICEPACPPIDIPSSNTSGISAPFGDDAEPSAEVVVSCLPGFTMVGGAETFKFTCNVGSAGSGASKYDGDPSFNVKCLQDCTEQLENGAVPHIDAAAHGSNGTVACAEGTLVGQPFAECVNGVFFGAGSCLAGCAAQVESGSEPAITAAQSGDPGTVSCSAGRSLVGGATATCDASSSFVGQGTCHDDCLPKIGLGAVTSISAAKHSNSGAASCGVGYTLEGSDLALCTDGNFTGQGTCQPDCPALAHVAGPNNFVDKKLGYGTMASAALYQISTVVCDGAQDSGETTWQCTAGGVWKAGGKLLNDTAVEPICSGSTTAAPLAATAAVTAASAEPTTTGSAAQPDCPKLTATTANANDLASDHLAYGRLAAAANGQTSVVDCLTSLVNGTDAWLCADGGVWVTDDVNRIPMALAEPICEVPANATTAAPVDATTAAAGAAPSTLGPAGGETTLALAAATTEMPGTTAEPHCPAEIANRTLPGILFALKGELSPMTCAADFTLDGHPIALCTGAGWVHNVTCQPVCGQLRHVTGPNNWPPKKLGYGVMPAAAFGATSAVVCDLVQESGDVEWRCGAGGQWETASPPVLTLESDPAGRAPMCRTPDCGAQLASGTRPAIAAAEQGLSGAVTCPATYTLVGAATALCTDGVFDNTSHCEPPSTAAPVVLTTGAPVVVTTALPNAVTTALPDAVTTALPEAVTTALPEAVTTAIPNAVTTALPEAVTTALPEAMTTAIPNAVTTALPEAVTTALPEAVTTAIPNAVTTAVPKAISTAVPDGVTTTLGEVVSTADAVTMTQTVERVDVTTPGEAEATTGPASTPAPNSTEGVALTSTIVMSTTQVSSTSTATTTQRLTSTNAQTSTGSMTSAARHSTTGIDTSKAETTTSVSSTVATTSTDRPTTSTIVYTTQVTSPSSTARINLTTTKRSESSTSTIGESTTIQESSTFEATTVTSTTERTSTAARSSTAVSSSTQERFSSSSEATSSTPPVTTTQRDTTSTTQVTTSTTTLHTTSTKAQTTSTTPPTTSTTSTVQPSSTKQTTTDKPSSSKPISTTPQATTTEEATTSAPSSTTSKGTTTQTTSTTQAPTTTTTTLVETTTEAITTTAVRLSILVGSLLETDLPPSVAEAIDAGNYSVLTDWMAEQGLGPSDEVWEKVADEEGLPEDLVGSLQQYQTNQEKLESAAEEGEVVFGDIPREIVESVLKTGDLTPFDNWLAELRRTTTLVTTTTKTTTRPLSLAEILSSILERPIPEDLNSPINDEDSDELISWLASGPILPTASQWTEIFAAPLSKEQEKALEDLKRHQEELESLIALTGVSLDGVPADVVTAVLVSGDLSSFTEWLSSTGFTVLPQSSLDELAKDPDQAEPSIPDSVREALQPFIPTPPSEIVEEILQVDLPPTVAEAVDSDSSAELVAWLAEETILPTDKQWEELATSDLSDELKGALDGFQGRQEELEALLRLTDIKLGDVPSSISEAVLANGDLTSFTDWLRSTGFTLLPQSSIDELTKDPGLVEPSIPSTVREALQPFTPSMIIEEILKADLPQDVAAAVDGGDSTELLAWMAEEAILPTDEQWEEMEASDLSAELKGVLGGFRERQGELEALLRLADVQLKDVPSGVTQAVLANGDLAAFTDWLKSTGVTILPNKSVEELIKDPSEADPSIPSSVREALSEFLPSQVLQEILSTTLPTDVSRAVDSGSTAELIAWMASKDLRPGDSPWNEIESSQLPKPLKDALEEYRQHQEELESLADLSEVEMNDVPSAVKESVLATGDLEAYTDWLKSTGVKVLPSPSLNKLSEDPEKVEPHIPDTVREAIKAFLPSTLLQQLLDIQIPDGVREAVDKGNYDTLIPWMASEYLLPIDSTWDEIAKSQLPQGLKDSLDEYRSHQDELESLIRLSEVKLEDVPNQVQEKVLTSGHLTAYTDWLKSTGVDKLSDASIAEYNKDPDEVAPSIPDTVRVALKPFIPTPSQILEGLLNIDIPDVVAKALDEEADSKGLIDWMASEAVQPNVNQWESVQASNLPQDLKDDLAAYRTHQEELNSLALLTDLPLDDTPDEAKKAVLADGDLATYTDWLLSANANVPEDSLRKLADFPANVRPTIPGGVRKALGDYVELTCQSLWADWGPWSFCPVTCGRGKEKRQRRRSAGPNCTADDELRQCNKPVCPQDCRWSEWGTWGPCSVSCGDGQSRRYRLHLQEALNGGLPCPGPNGQLDNCTGTICTDPTQSPDTMAELAKVGIDLEGPLDQSAISASVSESIPFYLANLTQEERMAMGHQLVETIPLCLFDGQRCADDDFDTFVDPAMGNCFTFNFREEVRHWTKRPGATSGLQLLLHSDQSEYLCVSQTSGFRVVVHRQGEVPFPSSQGLSVPLSIVSSLAVTLTKTSKMPPPYGDCTMLDAKDEEFLYEGNYTNEGCLRSCGQGVLTRQCSCADPRYKLPNGSAPCPVSEKACLDFYHDCDQFGIPSLCKHCTMPCNADVMETTVTSSKLMPSLSMDNVCPFLAGGENSCESKTSKLRNFARLEVFYDRLNLISFEETAEYGGTQVMSDVAGVMGIALGLSALTTLEFAIALLSLAAHKLSKGAASLVQ